MKLIYWQHQVLVFFIVVGWCLLGRAPLNCDAFRMQSIQMVPPQPIVHGKPAIRAVPESSRMRYALEVDGGEDSTLERLHQWTPWTPLWPMQESQMTIQHRWGWQDQWDDSSDSNSNSDSDSASGSSSSSSSSSSSPCISHTHLAPVAGVNLTECNAFRPSWAPDMRFSLQWQIGMSPIEGQCLFTWIWDQFTWSLCWIQMTWQVRYFHQQQWTHSPVQFTSTSSSSASSRSYSDRGIVEQWRLETTYHKYGSQAASLPATLNLYHNHKRVWSSFTTPTLPLLRTPIAASIGPCRGAVLTTIHHRHTTELPWKHVPFSVGLPRHRNRNRCQLHLVWIGVEEPSVEDSLESQSSSMGRLIGVANHPRITMFFEADVNAHHIAHCSTTPQQESGRGEGGERGLVNVASIPIQLESSLKEVMGTPIPVGVYSTTSRGCWWRDPLLLNTSTILWQAAVDLPPATSPVMVHRRHRCWRRIGDNGLGSWQLTWTEYDSNPPLQSSSEIDMCTIQRTQTVTGTGNLVDVGDVQCPSGWDVRGVWQGVHLHHYQPPPPPPPPNHNDTTDATGTAMFPPFISSTGTISPPTTPPNMHSSSSGGGSSWTGISSGISSTGGTDGENHGSGMSSNSPPIVRFGVWMWVPCY